MHYIRNVVVERIVLENLKEVIHYVSNYEDEFVRMIMDADVRQKNCATRLRSSKTASCSRMERQMKCAGMRALKMYFWS